MYLLDTNSWIAYLRQNNPKLVQRMLQENPADMALCSVVLAELLYGAHHGTAAKLAANLALIGRLQQRFASLPFDDRAATEYGRLGLILRVRERPSDRTT
jgi:tRNA(fMet)-specific endonuclease VapC